MQRHFAQWDFNFTCGLCAGRQSPPPQPNSIYMHSWPGRCKNSRQRLNWKWSPTAACSCCRGFGFSVPPVLPRPRLSRRSAGHPLRREGSPACRRGRGPAMGNAPLCQSCHSDKGVRAPGNLQDLDKTPDYYGCNSEESKDPQAPVSLG